MLAKSVPDVPDAAKVPGGLSYEPKWDGFRALVSWDGTEVVIGSRGAKPLTRYFPEVVAACREHLPERIALDGEIVVRAGEPGAQRLHFEHLGQRIVVCQRHTTFSSGNDFDRMKTKNRDICPLTTAKHFPHDLSHTNRHWITIPNRS